MRVPVLDDIPSVRPVIVRPDKDQAIQQHRSRMLKNPTAGGKSSSTTGTSNVVEQPVDTPPINQH